jgi:UDP-2-acetamido-2-deoxy-ribo-hexuluronate aminotransferase
MTTADVLTKKIQMVDLVGQHKTFQSELNEAIQKVQDHGAFINGPETKTFAQNVGVFLNVKHVIPCANGTDALQIALMAFGLQAGDEVITTSFNYVAAAEATALLGLKPVFVEVDNDTFNLDTSLLEKAITPKTKAIIAVHLFGQACNMEEIMTIAAKHNLYVIEDNAQSLGCDVVYKGQKHKAGTIGHIGTTSFFPTKNLGCMGDGGAIYSNDENLMVKCKSISAHGQGQRYEFQQIGINSRLDTLQAAILDVKLKYLNDSLEKRAHWANRYFAFLTGVDTIELPKTAANTSHSYNQFTLKVKNGKRDALKEFLTEAGIPSMIYYPKPLHLQPAFSFLGYQKGSLPISEKLCEEVLSLPIHPELDEEQVQFIASKIIAFSDK